MKWLWACLIALGGVAALSAAPLRLDLPAQDAARSLMALARQSDLEVVFLYDDLKRVQSPAVRGEFEPEEALQRLLDGTRFVARPAHAGRFVVLPAPPAPPLPVPATVPVAPAAPALTEDEVAPVRLESFVVTPSRFGITENLSPRSATFTHDEVARLPSLGEDVLRAVAHVPGLAGSDYSAKFWVRGAPFEKVLTRVDGATLIEPFHMKELGGALSVIDLETVSRLDLITGGFTTEYGDRLAGVLLMETDRPVDPRPRTTLALSVMGARATNRGTFDGGRGAWMLSGRVGYPDLSLEMADAEELTPRYHDAFAKVEHELTPNHTLGVSALHSRDRLKYFHLNDRIAQDGRTRDDYVWLRWQGAFGDRVRADTVLGGAWLGWDRVSRRVQLPSDVRPRRSLDDHRDLAQLSLRQDWSAQFGEVALLRTGFGLARGEMDYEFDSILDSLRAVNGGVVVDTTSRHFVRAVSGHTLGLHAAWRQRLGRHLVVEPGVRYDRASHAPKSAGASPRVNVAANFGPTTWRAAWGVFRQAQGVHELAVMDGETRFFPAEEARQLVLGVDHRLRRGLALRAEFFQRAVDQPRPHWENLVNPLRIAGELDFDRVRLAPTEARARGAELSVRGTGERARWSASYAWAQAEERIGGRWLPVVRDQRHTLRFDATWSPNERWDFSAAWQFRSGWPTTSYSYRIVPLANGVLYEPQLGSPLAERLPAYHRLDLRVTRVWRRPQGTVRVFVDVFNAYGADNPFRYDVLLRGNATQVEQVRRPEKSLPILPSAGVQWDF
jgi:outer membrane cobalamin receptor